MLDAGGPLLALGVALIAGILGGALARRLGAPTLTGYILVGFALGGHGFGLLDLPALEALRGPVNDLAIAAVLFFLGGSIRFDRLRGAARPLLVLSLVEAAITAAAVGATCLLVMPRADGALLLAVLAIEIAPATTVIVLREYGARGPTTDTIRVLTALANLWVVVLFEVALLGLTLARGGEAGPWSLLRNFGGSFAVGLVAGHVYVFLQERARWGSAAAPMLAVTLATIGFCKWAGVPHMLAFLTAGAVVVNRSRLIEAVERGLDSFAQPALVAFFVLAGTHLDPGVLGTAWLAVGAYVLARTAARILGTRIGKTVGGLRLVAAGRSEPPLGLALLCQAGAAIALTQYAAIYDPELSSALLTIVLGAVLIFELAGPLLLKHALVAAGEISLAQLTTRSARGSEALHPLRALGRTLRGRRLRSRSTAETVRVERIMRRGTAGLGAAAGLDEVLRFANQSRFDALPVVDPQGCLTGVIRLQDLEQVAYDPAAGRLVAAQDLAVLTPAEGALTADASLEQAERFFRAHAENCAAVVASTDDARLVGMLERAELLHASRALRGRGAGGAAA